MVQHDCGTAESPKYLPTLHNAHIQAKLDFAKDIESNIIQFSDSIVFSRKFSHEAFPTFIEAIANWQKNLLENGLLCRGGVTFGNHFVRDNFMFSKGLIDAYQLECKQARYPRIIVSQDLIELVSAEEPRLIKEDDGLSFIDYISYRNDSEKEKYSRSIHGLLQLNKNSNSSVQEKMRWLAKYADHKLGTSFATPQFS